jgi:N-methylhydantoinase B
MRKAIAELPQGTWRQSMTVDGYEAPVEIHAAMTIAADRILIDFEGTSPASRHGINVPMCYTQAYASYGIRCLVGSTIMNNAGSLAPIEVRAPEGCILNAPRPAAVSARHAVGQMLPDVMFGLLHQVLPDGAPAEGAASLWAMMLFGGPTASAIAALGATAFTVMGILAGGTGARPHQDGLSATAFPSRVRCVPIEISEAMSPVVVWRKELIPDSGGAGRQRGGLGQVLEIANTEPQPFAMSAATCDRVIFPARGRDGGLPGALGAFLLKDGPAFEGKRKHTVPAGERLILELPGGGGLGDPRERDRAKVAEDLRLGLITREAARRDYGYAGDAGD